MKFGPTKVTVQSDAIYDARSGKLVKSGLSTPQAVADYAMHHYIALPVVDNQGQAWNFEGKPVYCLRGAQYETVEDELPHVRRCSECGGMAVPSEEGTVERDCVRCTKCGQEFDARLEMMES